MIDESHNFSSSGTSYNDYSSPSSKLSSSSGSGLSRSNSLRATSTSNWKDLFPSLTRTPSNLLQSDLGEGSGDCRWIHHKPLNIPSHYLCITQHRPARYECITVHYVLLPNWTSPIECHRYMYSLLVFSPALF